MVHSVCCFCLLNYTKILFFVIAVAVILLLVLFILPLRSALLRKVVGAACVHEHLRTNESEKFFAVVISLIRFVLFSTRRRVNMFFITNHACASMCVWMCDLFFRLKILVWRFKFINGKYSIWFCKCIIRIFSPFFSLFLSICFFCFVIIYSCLFSTSTYSVCRRFVPCVY